MERWLDRFGYTADEWEELQRHWLIAIVCKRYSCLPTQAARELDRDPERLALRLLPLYRYHDAKAAADSTQDWAKLLEKWPDEDIMAKFMANAQWSKHERLHPEFEEDCEECEFRRSQLEHHA